MNLRQKVKYRLANSIKLLIQRKLRKCVIHKSTVFIHLWSLSEYGLEEGEHYIVCRGATIEKGKRVNTLICIPIIRD